MIFPENPSDGQVFEVDNGVIFVYDSSISSWTQVSTGRVPIQLATGSDDGAMSYVDFNKLIGLVVPPPQSTLAADDCGVVFRNGVVGLQSVDDYVKIESSLKTGNIDEFGDSISKDLPFKIHDFTYGLDFNLDLPKFINDMSAFNRVKFRGPKGRQGPVGDVGPDGESFVYTGPKGNKGVQGDSLEVRFNVFQEPFPVAPSVGLNMVLVDAEIVPDNSDPTKRRILFHRKVVGTNDPAKVLSFNSGSSPWLIALDQNSSASQLVYYVDIDPIMDTIYNTFIGQVDALKASYETIVQKYVGLMSAKFDQQKDALCCALEKCVSLTKNVDARQHMESVAAAALGKASIKIRGRKDSTATQISGTNNLQALDLYDSCWYTGTGTFPGSGPLNPIVEPSASPEGPILSSIVPSFGGGCNCGSTTFTGDVTAIASAAIADANAALAKYAIDTGTKPIVFSESDLADGNPLTSSYTVPGCGSFSLSLVTLTYVVSISDINGTLTNYILGQVFGFIGQISGAGPYSAASNWGVTTGSSVAILVSGTTTGSIPVQSVCNPVPGGGSSGSGGGVCNCASFTESWDNSEITSKLLELGNQYMRDRGITPEFTLEDRDTYLDGTPVSDQVSFTYPGCPPEGFVPSWPGYDSSFRIKAVDNNGIESGIYILGGNVGGQSTIDPDPNYQYILNAQILVGGGVGRVFSASEPVNAPSINFNPCNPIGGGFPSSSATGGGGGGGGGGTLPGDNGGAIKTSYKDCVKALLDIINQQLLDNGWPSDFKVELPTNAGAFVVDGSRDGNGAPRINSWGGSLSVNGQPTTAPDGSIVNGASITITIALDTANPGDPYVYYDPNGNSAMINGTITGTWTDAVDGSVRTQPITGAFTDCKPDTTIDFPPQAATRISEPKTIDIIPVHIDAAINNSILSSVKLNLPEGDYDAKIIIGRAKANDAYRDNVKFTYKVNGKKKSTEFQYRGEFNNQEDAQDVYEGLTASFSHSGGQTEWWLPAEPGSLCEGTIDIEVTALAEEYAIIQAGNCSMANSKIKWYEKAWQKKECCGCVLNHNGQDYIIISKSLENDKTCGGGEVITEPCINVFLRMGHPALAFPTFDGQHFIVGTDVMFKFDAEIDKELRRKIQSGETVQKVGNQSFDLVLMPFL